MEKDSPKSNWFVRSGIILLTVFLGAMVTTSFLCSTKQYQVTAGILSVLGMMIILILSEVFNSFSLGKILTLSKEVQKTREEKDEVKNENAELRQSLVHIATHVQSQVNTTIQAQGADFLRLLGVVKADEDEEDEAADKAGQPPEAPAGHDERASRSISRHRVLAEVESLVLKKYSEKHNFSETDIVRQIRFTDAFEHIDPICNRPVTFDGYVKSPTKERFLEVKTRRAAMGSMLWDRLYVMLSKVLLYRQAKKTDAELIVLLADLPEEEDDRNARSWDRFMDLYQPAIVSGLLRVETIAVTSAEYTAIEKDIEEREQTAASNQLLHRTQ
jgi:hypothetical protein